jgi:hypothetical protein
MTPEARDDMPLSRPHIPTVLRDVVLASLMSFLDALMHFLTARFALWREVSLVLAQTLGHAPTPTADVCTELLDIGTAGSFYRRGDCSLPEQGACND